MFHYDANHFSNLQKVNIESANRNKFKQWTLRHFKLNRINWLIFELIIINKKFLKLIILFKRDFHDSSLNVNERKIVVNALNKLSDKSKWKFRVFVHIFSHQFALFMNFELFDRDMMIDDVVIFQREIDQFLKSDS